MCAEMPQQQIWWYESTTKNCAYKVERAEETPRANRSNFLASKENDEASD